MTMPLAEVRGGIAISGIYDLEPIRLNYLNDKLGLDAAEAERNSRSGTCRRRPVSWSWLTARGNCPNCVASRSSTAGSWTERGLSGRLMPVDGADHFTILDALARPEGALTRAFLAMLGR